MSTPKLTAMAWTFNFKYRPRFSLQSYAAYHPELDQLSARGYNSTNAPGFIVFGHESIDGAHPQAVDPANLAGGVSLVRSVWDVQ